MKKNAIVGQSGGPTTVINSSLAGVYKTAVESGCKRRKACSASLDIKGRNKCYKGI